MPIKKSFKFLILINKVKKEDLEWKEKKGSSNCMQLKLKNNVCNKKPFLYTILR